MMIPPFSSLPQRADLHRVWLMRQGFLLLDFEDASADYLKCMLLSCTLQPLYLTSEEVGMENVLVNPLLLSGEVLEKM